MRGRHLGMTMLAIVATGSPDALSARDEIATLASEPPLYSVVEPSPPTGEVMFQAVRDLRQRGGAVELKLRQATVANSADWPVSFRATFMTANGEQSCTAVLIGPQVMLTAAHCVPTSGRVSYPTAAGPGSAACARHEAWIAGDDPSADFALCKLDAAFAGPPGVRFETVNLARLAPKPASPVAVLLTGYGCTDNTTKRQVLDGKYRIGLTALVDSSASSAAVLGARYYALGGGEANNLFTATTGPNLCPGDSGGPAFLPSATSGGAQGQYANRTLVGVNSRVFFGNAAGTIYGASMISALGAGAFEPWARRWLGSLPACGLTGALPNCRR